MTPDELNEAIARKLGYSESPARQGWWLGGKYGHVSALPPFSSDIGSAWEVVEAFKKYGAVTIALGPNGQASVSFSNFATAQVVGKSGPEEVIPRLICELFLAVSSGTAAEN